MSLLQAGQSSAIDDVRALRQTTMSASPQKATETEWQARMQVLQEQRGAALDQVVLMAGQIAVMQEQLSQLGKDLVAAHQRPREST